MNWTFGTNIKEGRFVEKERLETGRLWLRPLEWTDFAAVHSWAGTPANVRYMAWGPNTEAQTRQFLETAKPGKDFAVALKETGAVIGSCGIYADEAGDTAALGWILHMAAWKHGYGTEFGGALLRYGFEDLGLRRITAYCAAANYGSYRIMERNGMRREGAGKQAFWARVDQEWIDLVHYAMLAQEYFSLHPPAKEPSLFGPPHG
jgi:RimJ/RimL family protein N-acetyltransferase